MVRFAGFGPRAGGSPAKRTRNASMDRSPGATLGGCILLSPMTDRFLRACRREPVDRTPVWFMRQAGRYMAEYRALRERHSLLELCRTPELAMSITLQPVEAIDVDAAIIFSDLLLPFEPMGLAFDFVKGEGPKVEQPLRSDEDVDRLRLFDPREGLRYVLEAITMTRRELDGKV